LVCVERGGGGGGGGGRRARYCLQQVEDQTKGLGAAAAQAKKLARLVNELPNF
jgi:hypothetical protein